MTNWIDLTNFAITVGGFEIAGLGLFLVIAFPYISKNQRTFFIIFFSLLNMYIASDLTSQISLILLSPDHYLLSKLAVFGESLFSSILMPLLTYYMLVCAGEDIKKNIFLYISSTLWGIYFILLVITQFTTGIYYITQDNIYYRGSWYPVLLIPLVLSMLFNLGLLIYKRSAIKPKQRIAFAIYLSVPFLCMVIQMFSYGLLLAVIGTSISAFVMVMFILTDQMDQYVKQQVINARQRASITVLEMRPHFIYNTMTSIYYLCKQDPDKAQQVILDFNNYLRKNFTAIVKENTIPFNEELEHTQAYLAVEQVRYENMIVVHYDTPHTSFRLPPLTLQPIVENAVKYGLDPDAEPLNIHIQTRKTEHGSEITIKNNGSSFVEYDDKEPHIALNNIRERLTLMCHGTLTIGPLTSGGTIVTIQIPNS